MNKPIKELTPEKFQEIYTNKKLRNAVAYAHTCLDSNGVFEYKKAMMYPDNYSVTDEQIKKATAEIERSKIVTLKENKNNLLLIGMGMVFDVDNANDLNNYRLRTEFKNKDGHLFFFEISKGNNDSMVFNHAIDRDLEKYYEKKHDAHNNQGKFYNYKGLERKTFDRYKKDQLLLIINRTFDCNFTKVVIDNYDLSCDDHPICESL